MTRVSDSKQPAGKRKASLPAVPPTTDAQRRAAVILEVLAGIRTAQEAATALKISVNNYYQLERKALAGLVTSCEPARRAGRQVDAQRQVDRLERSLARCQQECQRQAALVRATQRAMGLPLVPAREEAPDSGAKSRRAAKGKPGARQTRRRTPQPRAARAARALRKRVASDESSEVQPGFKGARDQASRCLEEERHHDSSRTSAAGTGARVATGRIGSREATDGHLSTDAAE